MSLHVSSVLQLSDDRKAAFLASLSEEEAAVFLYDWDCWARENQRMPKDWEVYWLLLAGRGFGKTRTGAETIKALAESGEYRHIGLIAPTADDARKVMVEGESGILAVSPPWFCPVYEPALRQLTWPNGVKAITYSAEEPNRLRGPQHDLIWADEIAAWKYREAWDMALFGLRLGTHPKAIITTTPRPIKLIKELLSDSDTIVTRGSTYENKDNLAPTFYKKIVARYEGTRMGRQELYAEMLEDIEGALWERDRIDELRVTPDQVPDFKRVVVAVDPAVTATEDSDETGIIVVGKGVDDHLYLLDDKSGKMTPHKWAQKAIVAYEQWEADRIIAEVNNGGDLVEMVLRNEAPTIPYKAVRASRGKLLRAEPVAALYERGLVHHVGHFPKLEDQLCSFTQDFDRKTEGSPDRLDGLVWGATELMEDVKSWGFV